MRFLVDAQLPPALARWLADSGHEAEHVGDLGLLEASDRIIWSQAVKTQATLITKDQDFVALLSTHSNGNAVIWIRLGNRTSLGGRRVFD
jgi:predicted nuclease of predicted toxin-antitoxin system